VQIPGLIHGPRPIPRRDVQHNAASLLANRKQLRLEENLQVNLTRVITTALYPLDSSSSVTAAKDFPLRAHRTPDG
jgi:hypothetical protein